MFLDIPVSHVMTKKVTTVSPGQQLIDIKHIYEKKNFHHHIPVIENDRLVGIISLQDFLIEITPSSLDDHEMIYWSKCVKDIMHEHPITIPHDATLRQACRILAEGNIHALVVCEDNKVKGIISTADILAYLLMLDESDVTNKPGNTLT
ncbi:MAG: CBS domain-containing protein [Bacteroidia bacterium]